MELGLLKSRQQANTLEIVDNEQLFGIVQICLRRSYVSCECTAGGKTVETVWLCKICGEEREMWRKSGAWFFKVGQGQSQIYSW